MSIVDATTIPPPINWAEAETAAERGTLYDYILENIDKSRWGESSRDWNLLNLACRNGNEHALVLLLKSKIPDVNQSPPYGRTAMHSALWHRNYTAIKILLVGGSTFNSILSILCDYIISSGNRLLLELSISNGMRTNKFARNLVPEEIKVFEQGVLRCRDLIIVLLGLKRRRQILPKLDKFLIQQELAVAIWATRTDEKWSKNII